MSDPPHERETAMTYTPVPPFRFVEAREGHSRYDDRNGEPCYFANRTFNTGPTFSYYGPVAGRGVNELTLDMALEAGEVDGLSLEETRALVSVQWRDDIVQCAKCDSVTSSSDVTTVDGVLWCDETCMAENATETCTRCEETVSVFYGVGSRDDYACDSCSANHTHYCDQCEATVWSDSDHHENHEDEDCKCEAPHQNFSIAGSDSVRYENDTIYDVVMAGGTVREDGFEAIRGLVFDWYVNSPGKDTINDNLRPQVLNAVDRMNATYKNGDGVFAKRLRSAVYKRTKQYVEHNPGMYGTEPVSIRDDLLSKIGVLAREYSSDFNQRVSITRDLNQSADDFGHEGSCWWTEYARSRCIFKANAGFGLRTWEEKPWGEEVTGRVWVIPCVVRRNRDFGGHLLHPTHGDAEAYVVFNGYGALEENAGPQALAAMTGMSVSAKRYPFGPEGMYVNSDSRIVAPADVLALNNLRTPWDLPAHGTLTEAEPDAEVDVEAEAGAAAVSAALTASIIENNPAPTTATQQAQVYAGMMSAMRESLLEWHLVDFPIEPLLFSQTPGPSTYDVS